jgi:hypothetical protein
MASNKRMEKKPHEAVAKNNIFQDNRLFIFNPGGKKNADIQTMVAFLPLFCSFFHANYTNSGVLTAAWALCECARWKC